MAADFDGDADVDLFVTNLGDDAYYRNDGAGGFAAAGTVAGLISAGWSSSAALADFDRDGDLDLYVSRYVEYAPGADIFCGDPATGIRKYCDPSLFTGAPDAFYRNEGAGSFVEVTGEVGLGGMPGHPGHGNRLTVVVFTAGG
ncbi:MAG: VCBS repeat-containing protein [Pseudomonadota bacterium]